MQSEIKELFNYYIEQPDVIKNNTVSKSSEKIDKILDGLDENQTKIFEEIYDLLCDVMVEEDYSHFTLGFKLGLKLAAEAFLN